MPDTSDHELRRRTRFGELLRQRHQTPEEFSAEAERFACERGLKGTLSARHVQRLASGLRDDGRPLGLPRPATRRLLEEMLGESFDDLLAPARGTVVVDLGGSDGLRSRIRAGRDIDAVTVDLLRQRLELTRAIDRRLGASAEHDDLVVQIGQVERLIGQAFRQSIRSGLAALLVGMSALAGWRALDQGRVERAWEHYDTARRSAREAGDVSLEAFVCASQAVVLIDIGESNAAVELTEYARSIAMGKVSPLLAAWLAAGYGEVCAVNGEEGKAMVAFDDAHSVLPAQPDNSGIPYIVFNETHLARWRGAALAKVGLPEANAVLVGALERLDPSFARAEAALRVDLVESLASAGAWDQAASHVERARLLANQVGSVRQQRRLARVLSRSERS
ncbi:hypothetical protein L6E12_23710 [Actinokineospora sp. PR83]|uniref:hypothetical protein n=1 Tax=Actinokineospora sp. PR83 TaxID=2884908 RepID=UPI001F40FA90|nr:hypothetical protein [Actinokineospora sp. PR83]MCG8918791.1 hypothetical protein [Actinokineospora sp. PR83]